MFLLGLSVDSDHRRTFGELARVGTLVQFRQGSALLPGSDIAFRIDGHADGIGEEGGVCIKAVLTAGSGPKLSTCIST